ncbi:MAG: class I SAM-dependent methyltransferase [Kofleriaceae bacterium]|nr:class I SAM-dependent methyltransferase [Candidatus Methylomirabilis lanthanidiphila]
MSDLIDPFDGTSLSVCQNKLLGESGKAYPIISDTPIFFEGDARDREHNTHLTDEPLPPHQYYTKYFLQQQYSQDTRLLDLGSGDGVMSAAIAPVFGEVYWVNPGFEALNVGEKRGISNVRRICAAAPHLPFPKDYFDAVMSIFVIEHIPQSEVRSYFEAIRKILKPNGVFLIATDTFWFDKYTAPLWKTLGNVLQGRFKIARHRSNTMHVNLMVPSELRRILKHESFHIEEEDLFWLLGRTRRLMPKWFAERFVTSVFVFKCRLHK